MNIGIANDYRGLELKQKLTKYLKLKGYNVIDYGGNTSTRDDYPIYGIKLGEEIRDKKIDYGIAICGSAIGVSIACNKVDKVRCAKINTIEEVIHGITNDYINVIALSGNMPIYLAKDIIDKFLSTKNNETDPRYYERVMMIEEYEKHNKKQKSIKESDKK